MRKWMILALLLLGGIVGFFFFKNRKADTRITYREAPVDYGKIEVTILGTGTVQPENRVEIKPPVSGRIEKVFVQEGQEVKKGQILALMSSSERAALLDAARARGSEEVKKWEENYKPTPILAPIDGTIILRNVEAGQTFTSQDSVLVISDRLAVKAQVDETDIAEIQLRQSVKVVLDAYPKEEIPAHVHQIAYEAETVNNVTTYTVNVLPDIVPSFMRSGMTANVTFYVHEKKHVLVVPNEALRMNDGERSVLLRVPGQTAPVKKTVEVGLSDGKRTEVKSGLKEGDIVLIANLQQSSQSNTGGNPFTPFGRRRGGRR